MERFERFDRIEGFGAFDEFDELNRVDCRHGRLDSRHPGRRDGSGGL